MMKTKKRYKAKKGAFKLTDSKAQRYGDRIEKISKRGRISPDSIIDDAIDESSPLHDWFEWDDTVAGHAYRKGQARNLLSNIITVEILPSGKEEEIKAWHVPEGIFKSPQGEAEYIDWDTVKEDGEMMAFMERRGLKELKIWERNYRQYGKLKRIAKKIRDYLE